MSETILVSSAQNASINFIEIFYTSPTGQGGTRVDAFTATNNTDSNKTYTAYIFDINGAATNAVIPEKIVVRDKFDLGAPIIGHLIPPGGTLRMQSSAALSISFRVTGNEL
jgi:hypothetical protein